MATNGRKRLPAHLKIVEGNRGHRPIVPDHAQSQPSGHNGLKPPVKFGKAQQSLWDAYIVTASWLTGFDVMAAHTWVCLQSAYLKAPEKFNASKIKELRLLQDQLGLNPTARARLKQTAPAGEGEGGDAASKYFSD